MATLEEVAAAHTLRYEYDGDYCERSWLECSCETESGVDVTLTLETEEDWRLHFAQAVAAAVAAPTEVTDELVAVFKDAWHRKSVEIGRGIAEPGTKTRAALIAVLASIHAPAARAVAAASYIEESAR